jgi:NAD+ synthase (glutamine-hydrolysing)
MTIAAIQLNPLVGAIAANAQCMLEHIHANPTADVILFPELSLTGYPPEDLLYRQGLYQQVERALNEIASQCLPQQTVIIGHPALDEDKRYNQLSVIQNQRISTHYRKQALPNYATFDEQRYFTAGDTPCVIDYQGRKIGLLICEDVWTDSVVNDTVAAGADLLLVSNASPYAIHKQERRLKRCKYIAQQHGCGVVYLNQVGGQDELVFDGRSFTINNQGECVQTANHCAIDTLITDTPSGSLPNSQTEELYQALVLGIRDYVNKNQFPGILLGLSGGVDSALTLALAVDALGPDRVHAVMLPSRHTSQMSLEDAEAEANTLGCDYQTINIETSYQAFLTTLAPQFAGLETDATEENIQARCRGVILMALSNKTGNMVLTTGNKSEMAVGYSTLYGDLAGGFAPLKDIYKTTVYQLCHYRNSLAPVIPERVLTRAPSAELADNQTDQDTLPDYNILDQLIDLIIHEEKTSEEIAKLGFDTAMVADVSKRIYRNEYKRQQAPIGIRVSEYAFGRDRRYPITSGYSE